MFVEKKLDFKSYIKKEDAGIVYAQNNSSAMFPARSKYVAKEAKKAMKKN